MCARRNVVCLPDRGGVNMLRRLVPIIAVLAFGLAVGCVWLSVGVGAGVAVADDEAGSLRGGACSKKVHTWCANGVNPDQKGNDCRAQLVWDLSKNGNRYPYIPDWSYCGGTQINCQDFWEADPEDTCASYSN